jgi:mannitol-specific phosphotransferase system IIBC component
MLEWLQCAVKIVQKSDNLTPLLQFMPEFARILFANQMVNLHILADRQAVKFTRCV